MIERNGEMMIRTRRKNGRKKAREREENEESRKMMAKNKKMSRGQGGVGR